MTSRFIRFLYDRNGSSKFLPSTTAALRGIRPCQSNHDLRAFAALHEMSAPPFLGSELYCDARYHLLMFVNVVKPTSAR